MRPAPDDGASRSEAPPGSVALALASRVLARLNRGILVLGMLAMLGAAGILCAAVFLRYFLHQPTDWQDEMAVFLLVGVTFLCAAHVQAQRGHIGIEALAEFLPERVNRVRRVLVDVASAAFCTFFTVKSVALLHEAVSEGQTTSSAWAPPLAIPYSLMAAGMALLSIQLILQVLVALAPKSPAP